MESYLDGTLMGDPIDAQNGYYGAAGTTDAFEAETDTGTTTTTVYLRYTISLHAPDASFITEDRYDLDAEDVRPHSPIVMVGGDQDQYPDLSGDEYGTTVTADEAEVTMISKPAISSLRRRSRTICSRRARTTRRS